MHRGRPHSPVNADSTQVEDAGSAHHDIQRDEDVTVEPAEKPGAADHLHTTDRLINRAHLLFLSITMKCDSLANALSRASDRRSGERETEHTKGAFLFFFFFFFTSSAQRKQARRFVSLLLNYNLSTRLSYALHIGLRCTLLLIFSRYEHKQHIISKL